MMWLAAFTALLAAWVYTRHETLLFVIAAEGVALVVAGSLKLWRFIASHPAPATTEA